MSKQKLNRYVTKVQYSDDEKRFLLKNSKTMTVTEIAKHLKRTPLAIRNACSRYGYGYINK